MSRLSIYDTEIADDELTEICSVVSKVFKALSQGRFEIANSHGFIDLWRYEDRGACEDAAQGTSSRPGSPRPRLRGQSGGGLFHREVKAKENCRVILQLSALSRWKPGNQYLRGWNLLAAQV